MPILGHSSAVDRIEQSGHPFNNRSKEMNFNTNPATQVAIVTGASRGIGAAIAKRLARDGYAVVVNYAGRSEEADLVVNAITSSGGRAIAVKADVSEPAAVHTLFDDAVAAFGRVDVLVNNAGIMPPALPQLADPD